MADSEPSAAAENLASSSTPSPDTITEAELLAAASNLESANSPNTNAEVESAAAASNLASANTPSPDTIAEAEFWAAASDLESANTPNTKAEAESAAAASNLASAHTLDTVPEAESSAAASKLASVHTLDTVPEAESSAAASKLASANTPTSRPGGILATAHRLSKCKARTLGTARAHLKTVEENGSEVAVGLLGDSMIERMRTTGRCDTLWSWPSNSVLSDYEIQTMNEERGDKEAVPLARIEGVANFGCGGDKIQNVLYRVVGDPDQGLKGLVQELHPPYGGDPVRRNQKLWVIQAGTNNLHPKRGLKNEDLHAMDILLRTLHHMSRPGTKFLLTGLFYRTDIPKELVDKANVELQNLIGELQLAIPQAPQPAEQSHGGKEEFQSGDEPPDSAKDPSPAWDRLQGTFRFLPAPRIDDFGDWLEDKVHLNHEGYRKWMHVLLPKVGEMLPGLLRPATPQGRVSHFTKDNVLVLEGSSTDS